MLVHRRRNFGKNTKLCCKLGMGNNRNDKKSFCTRTTIVLYITFFFLTPFPNLGVESLKHHTLHWMMHLLRKNHGVEEKVSTYIYVRELVQFIRKRIVDNFNHHLKAPS